MERLLHKYALAPEAVDSQDRRSRFPERVGTLCEVVGNKQVRILPAISMAAYLSGESAGDLFDESLDHVDPSGWLREEFEEGNIMATRAQAPAPHERGLPVGKDVRYDIFVVYGKAGLKAQYREFLRLPEPDPSAPPIVAMVH